MPRLGRLISEAVAECQVDLAGATVLTEAATGPYAVTPVMAALAGAEQVVALTRDTAYGTVAEVEALTLALAKELAVSERITITTDRTPDLYATADVVTNSGHVRPIDGVFAAAIRPTAVVPLMFEAWEVQAGRLDLDLDGLLSKGVQLAGTNERHPAVDVFSYLGPMAVAQLADAGVSAYRGRIAVLCNNAFRDFLVAGLDAVGANVRADDTLETLFAGPVPDALVVAVTPTSEMVLSEKDLQLIAQEWPGTVVAQFWGDVDRQASLAAGVPCWPLTAPASGHMGVLPSRVGPDPIVRLQAGGLKVAQVLRKPAELRTREDLEFVDAL